MKWNYVDKDGNPKEAGVYHVTLLYPELDLVEGRYWKPTGKMLVTIDDRFFADLTRRPDLAYWKMCGQPDSGLVWTTECGSYANETVWAWAEIEEQPFPERLPAGVEKR